MGIFHRTALEHGLRKGSFFPYHFRSRKIPNNLFFVYIPASWLDVEALATALALIGKASIVSCFCIIFIYSSELFPTVIRTVGVGCCAFWGRVGSLLAPQILLAVNPTIII